MIDFCQPFHSNRVAGVFVRVVQLRQAAVCRLDDCCARTGADFEQFVQAFFKRHIESIGLWHPR